MDEAKKKNRIPINEEQKETPPSAEEALKLEIEGLTAQLADAQKEAAVNLDGWQRERAEFSNYKKRVERDQCLMRQEITGTIVKKYLVILDDLELALKDRPMDPAGEAWASGIALICKKLYTILESEGNERIFENKVPFDPNIHEAISHEENEAFESGEVIEVFRQGYKLGDRTLRPAMVRVAK
jgi:molecular chaperone GrpE